MDIEVFDYWLILMETVTKKLCVCDHYSNVINFSFFNTLFIYYYYFTNSFNYPCMNLGG